MEMLVNTVRMVDYDQLKEHALGDDNSLKENLALGIVNPEDFKKLNLTASLNLKLSNSFGNVVIKIKQSEDVPVGTILMPVSIWANQITGIMDDQILFKNIKVNTEATKDDILDLKSILNSLKK